MSETMARTDIAEIIISGGDERVFLHPETGANKYFINPIEFEGLLNRGSCTCSALNPDSYAHISQFDQTIENKGFEVIKEQQAQRIKNLLNFEGEDKFEVFFAPSGSDLAYFPTLITHLIHPQKKILNLLTCPEELGSGTQIASAGNYYMNFNQFDEKIDYLKPISPQIEIEVAKFPARDKEGFIIDSKNLLIESIQQQPNKAKIGSLVIGSKSGIENNINVIEEVKEEMLWVVDLCQFRNKKKLINELLDLNCMIMITGSKFYQAPPFCGVLLVPQKITRQIEKAAIQPESFKGFDQLFSYYDFPPSLEKLRSHFRKFKNMGLLYRWECALSEMESFDKIPRKETDHIITQWNQLVTETLQKNKYFELMPNMEMTNKSIISFRVKKEGIYLNNAQLKELFKNLVTDEYDHFEEVKKVFIGQPVNYGQKSFIRLAIGSYDIRKLHQKKEGFEKDLWLIDLLSKKIDHFAASS